MRRPKKVLPVEDVRIEKLVHGGQGIGSLSDGRRVFVWGALPGELVQVQLTKRKKTHAEGYAVSVVEVSEDRVEPIEPEMFLATSPWQIIAYEAEAVAKQGILDEAFRREGLDLAWHVFEQPDSPYGYRNKMEYNFWYDNDSGRVDLALHRRGTHQKVAVRGSELAHAALNAAGRELIDYINTHNIEARPLKSVIIRTSQHGEVGMSVFVTDESVVALFVGFQPSYASFEIVYSNPKSPASVATTVLRSDGIGFLSDVLLDRAFRYSTRSFFQVNIPIYEQVLREMRLAASTYARVADLYSGVGSIGLSIANDSQHITLVEISAEATAQAQQNIATRKNCRVVTASTESVLDYIDSASLVVVDPPRAGLHKDVVEQFIAVRSPKIIYLSCNPSTQARDVKMLVENGYRVVYAKGYNFFPRTPHIESLVIVEWVGAV